MPSTKKKEILLPALRDQVRSLKDNITLGSNDYKITYDLIIIDPEMDFRDECSFVDQEIIDLSESIFTNGLIEPLTGDFLANEKGKVFFRPTDGHRRTRAIGLLVEQGRWDRKINIRTNEKGVTLEDRFFKVFITQDSRPLTDLEIAKVFSKLVENGVELNTIVEKTRKSITFVKDMIILNKQTPYVKQAIRDRKTSATAVVKIAKDKGPEQTEDFIKKSIEGNIKVSVNTAEKIHKEKKEKLNVQVEMPFNLPETLEDMIKMRDDLLLITNRTVDQERQLAKLDDRIREEELNSKPVDKIYEPAYEKDLIREGSDFDTILLTKFGVTLESILRTEQLYLSNSVITTLTTKIFRFFRDELEPEA